MQFPGPASADPLPARAAAPWKRATVLGGEAIEGRGEQVGLQERQPQRGGIERPRGDVDRRCLPAGEFGEQQRGEALHAARMTSGLPHPRGQEVAHRDAGGAAAPGERLEAQQRAVEVGEGHAPPARLIARVDGEVDRLVAGDRGRRSRADGPPGDPRAVARRDPAPGERLAHGGDAGVEVGPGDPVRELRDRRDSACGRGSAERRGKQRRGDEERGRPAPGDVDGALDRAHNDPSSRSRLRRSLVRSPSGRQFRPPGR